MNTIRKAKTRYAWCGAYALAGGFGLSVLAYNVMGRAAGFENITLPTLIPAFLVGVTAGLVISFLVIRNRHVLLSHLATEREISARLKREIAERQEAETGLRDREAMLRLVIDNVPAMIAYIDRGMVVRFANRAYADYFGFEPKNIAGTAVAAIVDAETYKALEPGSLKTLAGAVTTDEGTLKTATGEERYYTINRVPHFGPDGGVLGYFIFVMDLTEHHAQEARLAQSQKMEAVGQLTGGVAHDFNNLLTVIQGNLELAGERNADAAIGPMIAAANKAAERGAELTQRLLAFSRKQTLAPEVVDVGGLIDGMTDILRRTIGGNIDVVVAGADDLWPCKADTGQLENALLNLAINAANAMPRGGTLTIAAGNATLGDGDLAAHPDVAPGDFVVLSVTDTGSGMSEAVMRQAFEPFFTTKPVGEGTGLGLSMVHGFITQSGGFVTLDSTVGAGTTVTLHLPRCASSDQPRQSGTDHPAPVPAPDSAARVLVVEDDADVRAMTVTMVRDLGYDTIEAADGKQALAMLEQTPAPDLLFTDMVLTGGMSGADIAQAARRQRPGIKILFTSGYADSVLAKHGGAATLDGTDAAVPFVTKPFRRADLAEKIRQALQA